MSLCCYLLYLLLNSGDGNDAFWCHSMLVKQSSSFSRKHRILSLQICVRETVRLTQKPGRLNNLATDTGMCAHCTWHMSASSASLTHRQAYHKTSKQLVNGESGWHWLCACVKAKGHHFEHLQNYNWHFSEPPTVCRGKHIVLRPFFRSYLKANKISKSKGTRKVEYAYHFYRVSAHWRAILI